MSKSWFLICPKCNNVDTIKWQQFSPPDDIINKNSSKEIIKPRGIIDELNIGVDR